jgi:hypothetical protein
MALALAVADNPGSKTIERDTARHNVSMGIDILPRLKARDSYGGLQAASSSS